MAVIGGSIAGCATAVALSRCGARVTVVERRREQTTGQGFGIATFPERRQAFVDAGYLGPGVDTVRYRVRNWVVRDGDAAPLGRVLWRQTLPVVADNWGRLWNELRAAVPERVGWRYGRADAVRDVPGGAEIVVDGRPERFDAVVGCDGHRSIVRRALGGTEPVDAGYVLWRGSVPATRLPGLAAALERVAYSAVYDGGHGILYRIPGMPGRPARTTWGLYGPRRDGGRVPDAPPAGTFDDVLPPAWTEVVRRTEPADLAVAAVADLVPPALAAGRLFVVGDAAALARPHTAAGVAKALEDAMALERACSGNARWDDAAAAYDDARRGPGADVVALGRRLGAAQVQHTPDWTRMSPADFERWWRAAVSG